MSATYQASRRLGRPRSTKAEVVARRRALWRAYTCAPGTNSEQIGG